MSSWEGLPRGTIRGYSMALVDMLERMLHPDSRWRPCAAEIEEACTEDRQDELNFNSFSDME